MSRENAKRTSIRDGDILQMNIWGGVTLDIHIRDRKNGEGKEVVTEMNIVLSTEEIETHLKTGGVEIIGNRKDEQFASLEG
jgi:hypothetical protein